MTNSTRLGSALFYKRLSTRSTLPSVRMTHTRTPLTAAHKEWRRRVRSFKPSGKGQFDSRTAKKAYSNRVLYSHALEFSGPPPTDYRDDIQQYPDYAHLKVVGPTIVKGTSAKSFPFTGGYKIQVSNWAVFPHPPTFDVLSPARRRWGENRER